MKKPGILFLMLVLAGSLFVFYGCSEKSEDVSSQVEVEFRKGFDYATQGIYDKALTHFQKAVEIDPEYARAWCGMGTIYRNQEKYEEAFENYNKAIELDPGYVVCYDNLGIAYFRTGNDGEAKKAFTKAAELDPGYADAHFNLGLLYEAVGDNDRSISEYEKYISLSSDSEKTAEVKGRIEGIKKGKN